MLRPSKDRPACPTASRCTKVFAKVVVALFIGISTSLSATAAEIEEIVVTARSVEESVRDILRRSQPLAENGWSNSA